MKTHIPLSKSYNDNVNETLPISPLKSNTSTSALRRPKVLFLVPLFAITICCALLPLSSTSRYKMGARDNRYHGKTLTVSNYTVVQGLFKQSDPEFKDGGYDLLSDSFGLIDQSAERWKDFEKSVFVL